MTHLDFQTQLAMQTTTSSDVHTLDYDLDQLMKATLSNFDVYLSHAHFLIATPSVSTITLTSGHLFGFVRLLGLLGHCAASSTDSSTTEAAITTYNFIVVVFMKNIAVLQY